MQILVATDKRVLSGSKPIRKASVYLFKPAVLIDGIKSDGKIVEKFSQPVLLSPNRVIQRIAGENFLQNPLCRPVGLRHRANR